MSWFTTPEGDDATQPVTLERVAAHMKANDLAFDVKDGFILTGFDGNVTIIAVENDAFLSIGTVATGALGTPEQLTKALGVINTWNSNTMLGTAVVLVDNDGDLVMRSTTNIDIEKGATDEQLDDFLKAGVTCNLQAIANYREEMGFPPAPTGDN